MQDIDLAYLAGLIDGEGCMSMFIRHEGKLNPYVEYKLEIGMADKAPVEWCRDVTGKGSIYFKPSHNPKRSDIYRWVVSSKEAAELCKLLLPFLKNKKREAELLIELSALKAQYKVGRSHNLDRQFQIVTESRTIKGLGSRWLNGVPVLAKIPV